ncbi:MAG: serine hydrolase [Flavobacteriaceae bacterium]|nr:serine hydrolase [Flavobacteriaceae bacterium]
MKNQLTKVSLFLLLFSNTCFSQYQYTQPKKLDDGWQTSDLKSKNIDSTRIYALFNQLHGEKHQVHSMLVFKNNELLVEEYFGDNAIDKPHDIRSVNKSIRAILLGIAIDKEIIKSVDDPISNYLKDLKPKKNLDPRKEQITIKDLITMSTGLECNDWDKNSKGQEDRVYKKSNWLQYTLDLPQVNDPGTVSNYCSMGTLILAKIIENASGMTLAEFAEKQLFKPLEITNIQWGHTSEKKIISAGKRLYMTSRDLGKIGQLILNNGIWDGRQVVSETWLNEMLSVKTTITGIPYGYLWWEIPIQTKEGSTISKTATGNGGQYIMVFPDSNIIAIFTGGAYNSPNDKLPFAIVKDIVLPAFDKK